MSCLSVFVSISAVALIWDETFSFYDMKYEIMTSNNTDTIYICAFDCLWMYGLHRICVIGRKEFNLTCVTYTHI